MIRVAVVGAGGLGGPITLGLVHAGFEVTVFDGDTVDISNLHRQLQFCDADLGRNKAMALRDWAGATHAHASHWVADNADDVCGDVDLIVDASDSAATKFAVNDWATRTGRPFVIAAALGVAGSVMLGAPSFACYRCWFEAPPGEADSCADAGVLGPILGQVAAIAVDGATALARGDRRTAGTLWTCADLSIEPHHVRQRPLAARADCPACRTSPMPPGQIPLLLAKAHHASH
ncbi:MAG TPA: ThiF family adenylyltransferase [Kofleriaceae bacterium]|nr:ThiF family adenylyltransferase [Kofleriaceae bacterium]